MLQKKEISSVELTKDVLARIDAVEPQVGAYLTLTKDAALAQAEAADKKIAAGEEVSFLDSGRRDPPRDPARFAPVCAPPPPFSCQ